jgi:hypothetical protein
MKLKIFFAIADANKTPSQTAGNRPILGFSVVRRGFIPPYFRGFLVTR